MRGTLDSLAAKLAATRRAQLDPSLVVRGRESSRKGNIPAMIDADMEFHFAIYAASGNPLIGETARVHWVHLRRVMGATLQASSQRASIWDEHATIAAAIESGDVKRAMSMSESHTRRANLHLVDELGIALSGETSSVFGKMHQAEEIPT